MIDWSKIAVPQQDLYDLNVIADLTNRSQRRPTLASKAHEVLFKCFDDQVTVGHYESECPYTGMENFVPDQELFATGIEYLFVWSEMKKQFPFFVSFINPIQSDFFQQNPFGSSSGCHWNEPGLIYLTANDAFPLAEAMVHEMAHLKLFSLGITMYSASGWITNPEDKMYYSSIKETQRPMPAVFHAQYSFIHILHLDLLLLKKFPANPDKWMWEMLTRDNLKRMKIGQEILEKNIQPTPKGKAFIDSFLTWSHETILEGESYLTSKHK